MPIARPLMLVFAVSLATSSPANARVPADLWWVLMSQAATANADLELAEVARSVDLTITSATRNKDEVSVDVVFALTNRGQSRAEACLGPSRSLSYETPGPSGVSVVSVDHPGCDREFALEPGHALTWSETIAVPDLSQPRIELSFTVQLVNPKRCGVYGCSATSVGSGKVLVK